MNHHEAQKSVTIFERKYLGMETSELYENLSACAVSSALSEKSWYEEFGWVDAKLFEKVCSELFVIKC